MVSKLSHGILLFSLSLSLLFSSVIPLYAGCSPYIGLATINEINVHSQSTTAEKEDRLIEVKSLVPEIITSEIWRKWYLIACSALGAAEDSPCSGKILIQDYYLNDKGELTPNDPAENSWLLTPIDWPYLDLNASKDNDQRGMTIHLYDENDDLIDFLDVDNYLNSDSLPSCTFPYDTDFIGGNDFNVQRLPDGTGDWAGSGGGNSGEQTDNDTNDPVQSDAPRLIITDAEAIAGNNMIFTISLTDPVTGGLTTTDTDVEISYSTLDWTALAGVDYAPLSGTITIPADSTSAEVSITTLASATLDNYFYLQLIEVTSEDNKDDKNAIIGFNFGKGTIIAPAGPDHYELSLPTTSISCLPTPITVTACADASSPCENPFITANGETATLSTSGGVLTATTLTFDSSGTANTTLKYPNASDDTPVTITFSNESLSPINANQCCPNGTNCVADNSCNTSFYTSGFIFTDDVNGPKENISTQEAGTESSEYWLRAVRSNTDTGSCAAALTDTKYIDIGYECNNPDNCSGSNLMSLNTVTATTVARNNDNNGNVTSFNLVLFDFGINGSAPFTLVYSDVGQVTLHATITVTETATTAAATLVGSSNAFVTKPAGFELTIPGNRAAADASGPIFKRSGELFDIEVKAVTAQGDATPSYGRESTPESVKLTNNLIIPDPADAKNPDLQGTFSSFSTNCDGISEAGAACGNFSWDEVGIIELIPEVLSGKYLSTENVIGTSSGKVGRFYPAGFEFVSSTEGTLTHADGTFSYFGHTIDGYDTAPTIKIKAVRKDGITTAENYKEDFFKLTESGFSIEEPDTDKNDTSLDIDILRVNATLDAKVKGTATYRFNKDQILYLKPDMETIPTDPLFEYHLIQISDGEASSSFSRYIPVKGGTELRYGRMVIENNFGPETERITLEIRTEYWDGSSNNWELNDIDNSTIFAYTKIDDATDLTTTEDENNAPLTPGVTDLSISGGYGSIRLTPATDLLDPGGTVDITLEAPDWLKFDWDDLGSPSQNPTATATFGIYRGRDRIISWEEIPVN